MTLLFLLLLFIIITFFTCLATATASTAAEPDECHWQCGAVWQRRLRDSDSPAEAPRRFFLRFLLLPVISTFFPSTPPKKGSPPCHTVKTDRSLIPNSPVHPLIASWT